MARKTKLDKWLTKKGQKQLYDLAAIANRPLKPAEMQEFVKRSNEIMLLLAGE